MPCEVTQGEKDYYNNKWYGYKGSYENMVESIACRAMAYAKATGEINSFPEYMQRWYKKHIEEDAKR